MNAQRVSRLTDEMKHAGVDALFISNPKNVQYLTGFHATMPGEVQLFGDPEGFAVAFEGKIHLLCDGRYIAGASELPGVIAQRIDSPTTAKVLTDGLRAIIGDGRNVIGFEADAMLHADAVGFFENLKEMECRPAQEIVSGLRLFKSKEEVDCIRKAQEITGACFDFIAKQLRVGISEHDVAFEIDTFLRRHGEGSSFKPIVAFAETSARPHYTPDPNRKLQKGQMVLLDFGGIYQGYCGDMTRMAVMGKTDARQREVYDLVLAAQTRCLNGIKPG
ncbi:MAG TPA: Xaa-Pro peptidase family protein, partial [Phycisphaerae bacterium]|nr:Xaa-Pro peptidase family protein [Phycisphaerae bacterium]